MTHDEQRCLRALSTKLAEAERERDEARQQRDLFRSRLCPTCAGLRRIHVLAGACSPAHDADCPTCVGMRVGGVTIFSELKP